jgi:hypothetical protein
VGANHPQEPIQEFASDITSRSPWVRPLATSVHAGATNHLLVVGPQQIKNPLQSLIEALVQANPILVQHKQVGEPVTQVSLPQAHLVAASYCSLAFHLPEGIVRAHTVQGQEQQTLQKGHLQKVHLHPKTFCSLHAPQEAVEEQQVVVVIPRVAVHVGPITLAFPGYALLLRFAGRNGGMSYTSSVCLVFHS